MVESELGVIKIFTREDGKVAIDVGGLPIQQVEMMLYGVQADLNRQLSARTLIAIMSEPKIHRP